jgi:flavin-dependent dehydrogenase
LGQAGPRQPRRLWLNSAVAPDIIIVGGGPAGLSTALHLVNLAPDLVPRILVLEKAHYPRHKLCAGALVSDAEVILEGLGLDVTEVPHVDATEAHLDFAGEGLAVRLPGTHALRIIRRNEFDAWLAGKARAAGIEISEGVAVRRVLARSDGVTIESSSGALEAAVVVGADGSNGVTRRSIPQTSAMHTARVLEVLVPVERPSPVVAAERSDRSNLPQSPGAASPHHADIAYLDFSPVPLGIAGYTWDFPTQVDGRPTRCWGIYDANLRPHARQTPLRRPLSEEMRRHECELSDGDLEGHPIRWFSPFDRFAIPRVLLVGDAAGADGIFGEGISIALGYGKIAARAIHDAVTNGDYSFGHYRRQLLASPLGRALTVRTAITQILYRLRWTWFQRFFWRVLKPVVLALSLLLVLNWARRMK